jgi:DNA-binding transcriptional LysR family regulator
LTLGSSGAIKQAVRAGLGVSLMSRAAVQAELSTGLLGELLLTDGPPTRPWFLLRSAVGPSRPSVDALCEFLRQALPAGHDGAEDVSTRVLGAPMATAARAVTT